MSNILANESLSTKSSRLGYLPALDGLRALAVLAVLFYHADVLWLPGGFLGVEIFFVVSGYLITSLLLTEYRADGSINFKQFWLRRARRLLPALYALIVAVLVYAVILLPDEVASLRADVVAAFTYITNWYLITAQQSYFETMGRPSLLRHLWSLAVEEQFYLVMPLVFAFVLARLKSRAAMMLLLLGAAASALWMGALFHPDQDPSRIYYGTDTRATGLLLGAALAFVRTPSEIKSRARKWLRELAGIFGLGALVVACLFLSEFDPFLYQGGMLLVAIATAFVIAAVISPRSPLLAPFLGIGILRWIGLRSYSLYLWHWALFMVTRPQLDTTLEGTPLLVLRFALTFALAEISYRVVESPIRHGALGKLWNTWKQSHGVRRWASSALAIVLFMFLIGGAYALGNLVIHAQPPQEPEYVLTAEEESVSYEETFAQEEAVSQEFAADELPDASSSDMSSVSFVISEQEVETPPARQIILPYAQDSWLRAYIARRAPLTNSTQADAESWRLRRIPTRTLANNSRVGCDAKCETRLEFAEMKEGIVRLATPTRTTARKPTPAPITKNSVAQIPLPARVGPAPILAIGDSVMLGATHYFRKVGLDVDVDAKIGRQVSTAIKLLRERQDAKLLAPIVIVHLGNNGTFTAKQFDEMMTVLHDVPRVIFLNTKVPRKWQEPNNNALVEGVKKYPNAMLVDWNATSYAHSEWFWKDGIHLRPEGAKVYANLLAEIVNQSSP